MKLKSSSSKLYLSMLFLLTLCAGCASNSPLNVQSVPPAMIPPLSESAKQPTRTETFSETVQKDITRWQLRLKELGLPDLPAKDLTSPSDPPPQPKTN